MSIFVRDLTKPLMPLIWLIFADSFYLKKEKSSQISSV